MDAVVDKLLQRSAVTDLLYVSELIGGTNVAKMDHLVCFLPGVLALGTHFGAGTGLSRSDGPQEKARPGYREPLERELLMQVGGGSTSHTRASTMHEGCMLHAR
jgi:hypothetical protein